MQLESFEHNTDTEKNIDCLIFNPKEYDPDMKLRSMNLFIKFCLEGTYDECTDLFRCGDMRCFIN